MTQFKRQPSARWHAEVPGTRWFRADLHLHTIDDLPGARAKWPQSLNGGRADANTIQLYAREFLKAAVGRVEVLGITPHCPSNNGFSAVWAIVDEWSTGVDDDNVPFRDKIYAVFPGFEPSLRDGAQGVHVLFLFDPEIGRDAFKSLFDKVMGSTVQAWTNSGLQMSSLDAEAAFNLVSDAELRQQTKAEGRWQHLLIAPHIENANGWFGGQKAQVLGTAPSAMLSALELSDNKLDSEMWPSQPQMRSAFEAHRLAFVHGTDAYAVQDIGKRFSWVKLGAPRIEALRQAFLAYRWQSRARLAFVKDITGAMVQDPAIAVPLPTTRPWLRSVEVSGGLSFFGGSGNTTRFEFSPDLTCVIGGSMSGKSTLLDGLRMHFGAAMPDPTKLANVKKDVEERARSRFLVGNPQVKSDVLGPIDGHAKLAEQWPARFYGQHELQLLATDPAGLEDLLLHLVPEKTASLKAIHAQVLDLDRRLAESVPDLVKRAAALAEAEQLFDRAGKAQESLQQFATAGIGAWRDAQAYTGRLTAFQGDLESIADSIASVEDSATTLVIPTAPGANLPDPTAASELTKLASALQTASAAHELLANWTKDTAALAAANEQALRRTVVTKLVDLGKTVEELGQFDALGKTAANFETFKAGFEQQSADYTGRFEFFQEMLTERSGLVDTYRQEMEAVGAAIEAQFDGRVRVAVKRESMDDALHAWVLGLRSAGVTAWWNQSRPTARLTLLQEALLQNSEIGQPGLSGVGMSPAVAKTFVGLVNDERTFALWAMRCPDRYTIQKRLGESSEYRDLDQLSGGEKLAVLLSLVFEASDDRPLVIDQPEDELDNRYMYDMVIPALLRLKGRRQVIIATHNANLVVNADADQVIVLAANANRGHVDVQGSIEEAAVRDAIVRILDGGEDAFKLRKQKYGF